MSASRVSPEIKAAAIADLLAGEQPAVVAAKYGVDPATVRQWKARHVTPDVTPVTPDVTPDVTPVAPIQRPTLEAQQQRIGALVLDLLAEKLTAAWAIAKAAQNPDWLARQSAADLATLGAYLDQSAFALGDRLANRAAPADE